MAWYRVYSLYGNGRIFSAEMVEAGSDAEAIETIRDACHFCDCELWLDTRPVGRIPGRGTAATPRSAYG
jgi:hypothetical protein